LSVTSPSTRLPKSSPTLSYTSVLLVLVGVGVGVEVLVLVLVLELELELLVEVGDDR
jgi:hypothetical protein